MGRISLLLLLLNFVAGQQSSDERNLLQLENLLATPQISQVNWRMDVWRRLRLMEHVDSVSVLKGWELLAESQSPSDQANFLLYQRRHQLMGEWPNPLANRELAVEWSLYLWGKSRLAQCDDFMTKALAQFPDDERLIDNLAWLRLQPVALTKNDDPRAASLHIFARRK